MAAILEHTPDEADAPVQETLSRPLWGFQDGTLHYEFKPADGKNVEQVTVPKDQVSANIARADLPKGWHFGPQNIRYFPDGPEGDPISCRAGLDPNWSRGSDPARIVLYGKEALQLLPGD